MNQAPIVTYHLGQNRHWKTIKSLETISEVINKTNELAFKDFVLLKRPQWKYAFFGGIQDLLDKLLTECKSYNVQFRRNSEVLSNSHRSLIKSQYIWWINRCHWCWLFWFFSKNSLFSYNSFLALTGCQNTGGVWVHHAHTSKVFEAFVS